MLRNIFVVLGAWLLCACSYKAIQVNDVTSEVMSISCIELGLECQPIDLTFETVKFGFTTFKDIEAEMEGSEIHARCSLDGGEYDNAYGPYHQDRNISKYPHNIAQKGIDGKYHYTLYAFPNSEGLNGLAQQLFKDMECSVWGVDMSFIYPRTSYFGLTNSAFQEKYEAYRNLQSSPNNAPKPTQ